MPASIFLSSSANKPPFCSDGVNVYMYSPFSLSVNSASDVSDGNSPLSSVFGFPYDEEYFSESKNSFDSRSPVFDTAYDSSFARFSGRFDFFSSISTDGVKPTFTSSAVITPSIRERTAAAAEALSDGLLRTFCSAVDGSPVGSFSSLFAETQITIEHIKMTITGEPIRSSSLDVNPDASDVVCYFSLPLILIHPPRVIFCLSLKAPQVRFHG